MTNPKLFAIAAGALIAIGGAVVKFKDLGDWVGPATLDGRMTDILNKTPGATEAQLAGDYKTSGKQYIITEANGDVPKGCLPNFDNRRQIVCPAPQPQNP